MYRWASFVVLIVTIIVIGALFFRILAAFFVPLFLAAILTVVFQPLYQRILERCKGRRALSSLLASAAVAMVVVIPAVFIVTLAILEGVAIVGQGGMDQVPNRLMQLRRDFGLELPLSDEVRAADAAMLSLVQDVREGNAVRESALNKALAGLKDLQFEMQRTPYERLSSYLDDTRENLERARTIDEEPSEVEAAILRANRDYQALRNELSGGTIWRSAVDLLNPTDEQQREWTSRILATAQSYLVPVGGAAAAYILQSVFGLVITILAVYFFFYDGPGMIETIMKLSPLDDRYERELLADFANISRSVVVATLLSAAVQGALAGLGFQVAGVGSVFLLTLLTFLFAMVPFFGAATVWLPVALWLFFFQERNWAAILMGLYGMVIVSNADNVVKLLVLHGRSQLHPLLALLSVLGGVQTLGPIGILVGPMIVVVLQSLLNILHRELTTLDRKSVRAS